MKRKKKKESGDWLTNKLYKKTLEFFINATAEDIRDLLKKSHYEEYTGINPDTLEIRQSTEEEIQEMRREYSLLQL